MTNPQDSSAKKLLAQYRAGDEYAFAALFDSQLNTYQARVRRWLNNGILRKVSVADILQEARLVAFRRRADFRGEDAEAFRRWVLGIIDRKAQRVIDHYAGAAGRNLDREVSRSERPSTVDHCGHEPSPSQVAVGHELLELAEQAREGLGEADREVLRLYHDEQLDLKQIGERMGRSHEATRKLHARALLRFGASLQRMRGEHYGE
ncbi:MAG: sigma-70 family RNA polymerase sigma factor [Planctomycetota bacterium]|jgi:RNA polymerase sigma factor (sigma-70 family)